MMCARRWLIFTALAASLLARSAGAEDFEEKRYYLTPFVGWTFFDRERQFLTGEELPDDFYFGARAGVRLNDLLWIDLAGGYTPVTGCCDWVDWTHFSGNLMLSPASERFINPFLSVGGGWSVYKHSAGSAEQLGTFEAAGGVRLRLSDAFGLRLEVRNVLAIPKGPFWDSVEAAHIDDIIVGVGLNFGFGGGEEPDSDGDDVPDNRDRCPDTPRGCIVDADGCPIDSDGDGVCDGLDQCPNTASGATVDAVGCVVEVEIKKLETELLDTGKLRISDIHFDFNKADIRPDSYNTLDTVGKVLTKWPGLQIEIGGHCDSRGSAAYNRDLSDRRAASVRAYLLAHFPQFSPDQLTSKGYGESDPLVPNDSEENMAKNRRVEFTVLNKEMLKQEK